jgi:trans-aconitate methyltransferase
VSVFDPEAQTEGRYSEDPDLPRKISGSSEYLRTGLVYKEFIMSGSTDLWDAKLYDASHSFVNQMAKGVVDLLAPKAGERILDLGCGTGPLTSKIAEARASVLGVDASPAMVAQARQSYPSLQFEVMNATSMRFDKPFDAIFSNAVLHWIKPPALAAQHMRDALKPGGRLILEMGGKGCVAKILQSAIKAGQSIGQNLNSVVDINYFPGISEYSSVLESVGFEVRFATLFDRPTPLSDGFTGLRNWIRMFRPGVEAAVPATQLENFYQSLEQLCRDELLLDGVWNADYRRLRVMAVRI